MTKARSRIVACAIVAALIVAADTADAQTIPEGQSCGGLFCDLGIVGHKTAPAPDAAPILASPRAEAVPPENAEAAPTRTKTHIARKKKQVAHGAARAPKVAAAARPAAVPSKAPPAPAAPLIPVPTISPTAAAEAAKPVASEPSVILNPFSQPRPSTSGFRPIY